MNWSFFTAGIDLNKLANKVVNNRKERNILRDVQKYEAEKVAYDNGIDPGQSKAAIAGAVSDSFKAFFGSGGEAASRIWGNGNQSAAPFGSGQKETGIFTLGNILLVFGGLLLFVFLLGGKRRNKM